MVRAVTEGRERETRWFGCIRGISGELENRSPGAGSVEYTNRVIEPLGQSNIEPNAPTILSWFMVRPWVRKFCFPSIVCLREK